MTKDELEQSIYARTRRYVGDDALDAILDLLAASRRAALTEAASVATAKLNGLTDVANAIRALAASDSDGGKS